MNIPLSSLASPRKGNACINDAKVWWMQGDGDAFTTPGGTLRVFGKRMNLRVSAEASLTRLSLLVRFSDSNR